MGRQDSQGVERDEGGSMHTTMMNTEHLQEFFNEETRKIVEILKLANPLKIIRFGSAACGDLRWKSDLDLCVIIERPKDMPRFRMHQALDRMLQEHDYHYDVPIEFRTYTPQEYEDLLTHHDFLVRDIAQGEVLYERSEHDGTCARLAASRPQ
jgi:predicted nucleotidyltransferase